MYNIFLPFFVFVPGCESCQSDGGWWFHLHCSWPLHKLQGCPGERQDAVRFCCEEIIAWWSDFPLKKRKKRMLPLLLLPSDLLPVTSCRIRFGLSLFIVVYKSALTRIQGLCSCSSKLELEGISLYFFNVKCIWLHAAYI